MKAKREWTIQVCRDCGKQPMGHDGDICSVTGFRHHAGAIAVVPRSNSSRSSEPLQDGGRDSLFDFPEDALIALRELLEPEEDLPQSDRLLRLIDRALESKRVG